MCMGSAWGSFDLCIYVYIHRHSCLYIDSIFSAGVMHTYLVGIESEHHDSLFVCYGHGCLGTS